MRPILISALAGCALISATAARPTPVASDTAITTPTVVAIQTRRARETFPPTIFRIVNPYTQTLYVYESYSNGPSLIAAVPPGSHSYSVGQVQDLPWGYTGTLTLTSNESFTAYLNGTPYPVRGPDGS